MIKQTFDYTDFNGHKRTAEMYFHLSEIEVIDFSGRKPDKVTEDLEVMVATENIRGILAFLRDLIAWSYGQKSEDGITFDKSEEITRKFVQSAYYSDWLFSLFENDAEKGIVFIKQVLPASLIEGAKARVNQEDSGTPTNAQSAEFPATRSELRGSTRL